MLVSTETPAQVSISGLALPFGDRYLLRPGTYTVRASAGAMCHWNPPLRSTPMTVRPCNWRALLPGLVSIDSAGGRQRAGRWRGRRPTPLRDLPIEAGSTPVDKRGALPALSQVLEVTGRNIPQQLTWSWPWPGRGRH